MQKTQFEEMLVDVGKYFKSPDELISSGDLTRPQKLKLLEQWDYDMQLLLTASEENMTGSTDSTAASAHKVTEIRKALSDLGAEHDPEATGPGKVGASVVNK
ncbi:MAG: hypothetical protein ABWY00_07190 [Dongiaceae bacterium]